MKCALWLHLCKAQKQSKLPNYSGGRSAGDQESKRMLWDSFRDFDNAISWFGWKFIGCVPCENGEKFLEGYEPLTTVFIKKIFVHSFYTPSKDPPFPPPAPHQPPLPTHPLLPPTRRQGLPCGGTFSRGKSKPFPLPQGCMRCPIIGSGLQKARSCTRDGESIFFKGVAIARFPGSRG